MSNPNINIDNLPTRFSSENQPKNKGRKKNRFREAQRNYEMSIEDVQQVLTDELSMTVPELKALIEDPNTPSFNAVIAAAILQSGKDGSWAQVGFMLDRLFGRTIERRETKDITDYSKQIEILEKIRQAIQAKGKTPITENVKDNNK